MFSAYTVYNKRQNSLLNVIVSSSSMMSTGTIVHRLNTKDGPCTINHLLKITLRPGFNILWLKTHKENLFQLTGRDHWMDPIGFSRVTKTMKQFESWRAYVNSTFNGGKTLKQFVDKNLNISLKKKVFDFRNVGFLSINLF